MHGYARVGLSPLGAAAEVEPSLPGPVWLSSSQLSVTQSGRSETHSKKLFVSAQLKCASFGSAGSVHGYARVRLRPLGAAEEA